MLLENNVAKIVGYLPSLLPPSISGESPSCIGGRESCFCQKEGFEHAVKTKLFQTTTKYILFLMYWQKKDTYF